MESTVKDCIQFGNSEWSQPTWVTWGRPNQFRPCLTVFCLTKAFLSIQSMDKVWWHFLEYCPNIPWPLVRGFPRAVMLCILSLSKVFTIPLIVHQFLWTAALPGVRAKLLFALHVLLMTVCICAVYPSPCCVFFRLKACRNLLKIKNLPIFLICTPLHCLNAALWIFIAFYCFDI